MQWAEEKLIVTSRGTLGSAEAWILFQFYEKSEKNKVRKNLARRSFENSNNKNKKKKEEEDKDKEAMDV